MAKYQVTKNVIYNFLGQIALFLISFFSVPFIIHSLGNDLYGVYVLIAVVAGYFSVLDLGLGASLIKYIAEYNAKNDKKTLEKIIGTALFVYVIVGLTGGMLIFLFTQSIVSRLLHIPPNLLPLAAAVFYISAIGFFVNMILTVFNAIPAALQRMDIVNSRNVLFGFINTLGIVALLFLGRGLIEVVIWSILTSIFATVVFLRIILKLLPGVHLYLQFEKGIFLGLLRFGGFKLVSNISGQVVFQLDRVLVGFFLPIAAVTLYTAPTNLVQKVMALMTNITSAVFPELSHSYSLGDRERIKDLYLRTSKVITFTVFPIMTMLFLFAEPFLNLWLGVDFAAKSAPVLRILAAAYFVAAMSAPGVIVSDAAGKPELPALFSVISAVINLTAALVLIPRLGIEGAAYALLINFISQVPIFIALVNKKIVRISSTKLILSAISKPVLAGIASAGPAILVSGYFHDSLPKLVLGGVVYGAGYLVICLGLNTFDRRDYSAFKYLLSRVSLILIK